MLCQTPGFLMINDSYALKAQHLSLVISGQFQIIKINIAVIIAIGAATAAE